MQTVNMFKYLLILSLWPGKGLLLPLENETSQLVNNDQYSTHRLEHGPHLFQGKRGKRSSNSQNGDNSKHAVVVKACTKDVECIEFNSRCDNQIGRCYCPPNYVSRQGLNQIIMLGKSGQEGSRPSPHSSWCYKAAIYGDLCNFDEQCVIQNSVCTAPTWDKDPKKSCKCKDNYENEAGQEKVLIGSNEVVSQVVCRPRETPSNTASILVIIAILISTIIVSSCLIVLFKMKRRKPRPVSDTLTSISGAGVPMGQAQYVGQPPTQQMHGGHIQSAPMQAASFQQQQHLQQQQQQRAQALAQQGYPVNPAMGDAIMGSAQAEFQNDFIEVFPMHHLEPCPEKNTSAILMQ